MEDLTLFTFLLSLLEAAIKVDPIRVPFVLSEIPFFEKAYVDRFPTHRLTNGQTQASEE